MPTRAHDARCRVAGIFGVAALLLSACGFQLRAAAELSPALQRTYIETENPYRGISPALRGELQSAGAEIVARIEEASAVLVLINERSQSRVLSVGSGGRAAEYELYEAVTFAVRDAEGGVLLEQQTLSETRDLVFDETELLGKVSESEDIRRQMKRNLARQVVRRIAAGTRQP